MKRKALITATAVLLVAVMCLATASYAWFTGANTAKIEAFQINVQASDSALLLAAADASQGNAKGAFDSNLSKADWSTGWAILDSDFEAHSTADAKTFFPAEYANDQWTTKAADQEGYMLFSFWVRAPKAGTANIKFDVANSSKNESFQQAIKYAIGHNATVDSATVGTMSIYDIKADSTDSYRPCQAADAVSKKDTNGYFIPATEAATGFAAARTQAELASTGYDVTFDAAGDKLVTVAIWLEGMDKECSGNWNLTGEAFALTIGWADAATNA